MMDIIKEKIKKIVRNKPELNFIGVAVTPLHANGIDAVIEYLLHSGIEEINGYVLIIPHGTTGYAISSDNFANNCPGIEYIQCENIYKAKFSFYEKIRYMSMPLFQRQKKEGTLYIAWTSVETSWYYYIGDLNKKTSIVYIGIDDGAGTYEKKKKTIKEFFSKEYMRECYDKLMIRFLRSKGKYIPGTIFVPTNKQRGTIRRNESFSTFYENAFRKSGASIPKTEIEQFEECILINTQCLEENDLISAKTQADLYNTCLLRIKDFGIHLTIKTHPREKRKDLYNKEFCEIANDTSYSQESIIANCTKKPYCVIGLFSSTLLNLYGIFDIPAISLARVLISELNADDQIVPLLESYIQSYQDIIIFPNDWSELIEYLETILEH